MLSQGGGEEGGDRLRCGEREEATRMCSAGPALQGLLIEREADTLMKNENTSPAPARQTFAADVSNPIVFNKTANWVWESPQGLAKPVGCLAAPLFLPTQVPLLLP